MNSGRDGLGFPAVVEPVIDPPSDRAGAATTQAATHIRPIDLDLMRLSYVCLANTVLQGLPERSLVLSRIHRFFDASPDRASVEGFSLSALIDGGGPA